MATKLIYSLALALGLSACVLDDEEPEQIPEDPGSEQEQQENLPGNGDDPPGDVIPGPGDNTCGGEPRLVSDGPCAPD